MKTTKFDPVEHLDTEEVQVELISEALETSDTKFIAHAIETVARARGMTQLSKDSGVAREALYHALSDEGDPHLSTLISVLSALRIGLKAEVKAIRS